LIVPAEAGCQAAAFKVTLLRQETIEDAHCLRSTVSVVPVTDPPPVNTGTYEGVEFDAVDDGQGKYGEQVGQGATFTHLLYTSWPDHGVPQDRDRDSLVAFIQLTDRINRDMSIAPYPSDGRSEDSSADPDPPVIVGCSAGVGRTGTFIALSSLMRHIGFLPPPVHPTQSLALSPSPLGNLPDALAEDGVAQEIDSLREQRQRMVERPEQVVFIYEVLLKNIFSPS
jgi:protein-tyrosine phosphatase